jgi:hypothetical protein
LIFGLFFISRFFFLANYPHFYDSPEYYQQSLSNNFFISLSQGHESIHPLYLFLTQLLQKIIPGQNVWELTLIAAFFGLVSFVSFYFLIKRNYNQKIALFSLIPLIFFPHLWLIQTNVLHESLNFALFLLSLLFFDFFLTKKNFSWFLLSTLFLGLAIFDFVGILLWSPVFLGLAILKSKKINWSNILWGLLIVAASFLLAIGGLYSILRLSQIISPIPRLKVILFSYGGGIILSGWGFLDILRILRNVFLILIHGYSFSAILALIISVVYFIKKRNWPVLIFFLSFFLPFLLTGKFWYGGLFGRYSALIAYLLALALALIPWRKIYCFLIIILFLSFLPTFIVYQKTPISKIQAGLIGKTDLKENDMLVLSDYQRPQLVYLKNKVLPKEGSYSNAVYLGGDQDQQKIIENKIEEKLKANGRVLISQQAINFPYWQYDGQQIHIISKGDKKKAQLKEFLSDKKLKVLTEDFKYPLLRIYQLSW